MSKKSMNSFGTGSQEDVIDQSRGQLEITMNSVEMQNYLQKARLDSSNQSDNRLNKSQAKPKLELDSKEKQSQDSGPGFVQKINTRTQSQSGQDDYVAHNYQRKHHVNVEDLDIIGMQPVLDDRQHIQIGKGNQRNQINLQEPKASQSATNQADEQRRINIQQDLGHIQNSKLREVPNVILDNKRDDELMNGSPTQSNIRQNRDQTIPDTLNKKVAHSETVRQEQTAGLKKLQTNVRSLAFGQSRQSRTRNLPLRNAITNKMPTSGGKLDKITLQNRLKNSTTLMHRGTQRSTNPRLMALNQVSSQQQLPSPHISLNQLGSIKQVLPHVIDKPPNQQRLERSNIKSQMNMRLYDSSAIGGERLNTSTYLQNNENRGTSRLTAHSSASNNRASLQQQPQLIKGDAASSNIPGQVGIADNSQSKQRNIGTNYYIASTQEVSRSQLMQNYLNQDTKDMLVRGKQQTSKSNMTIRKTNLQMDPQEDHGQSKVQDAAIVSNDTLNKFNQYSEYVRIPHIPSINNSEGTLSFGGRIANDNQIINNHSQSNFFNQMASQKNSVQSDRLLLVPYVNQNVYTETMRRPSIKKSSNQSSRNSSMRAASNIEMRELNSQDNMININLKQVYRGQLQSNQSRNFRKIDQSGYFGSKRNDHLRQQEQFVIGQQIATLTSSENYKCGTVGMSTQQETNVDTGRFADSPVDHRTVKIGNFSISYNEGSTIVGQDSNLENKKSLALSQMRRVKIAKMVLSRSNQRLIASHHRMMQLQILKSQRSTQSAKTGNFMKVKTKTEPTNHQKTPNIHGKSVSPRSLAQSSGPKANQKFINQNDKNSKFESTMRNADKNAAMEEAYSDVYIGDLMQEQFKSNKRIKAQNVLQEVENQAYLKEPEHRAGQKMLSKSATRVENKERTVEVAAKKNNPLERFNSVQALLSMESSHKWSRDEQFKQENKSLLQSLQMGLDDEQKKQKLFNDDHKGIIKVQDLSDLKMFDPNKSRDNLYYGQTNSKAIQEALHGSSESPQPSGYNMRRQKALQKKLLDIQLKNQPKTQNEAHQNAPDFESVNETEQDEFDIPEKNPIWLANQNYYRNKSVFATAHELEEQFDDFEINDQESKGIDALAEPTQNENVAALQGLIKHKILQYCEAINESEESLLGSNQQTKQELQFERSKRINIQLYKTVMNSLNQILSNEEDIRVIDTGVGYCGNPPLKINIGKMNAIFFYVKVAGKPSPMSICLQDGSEFLRAQNPSVYPGPTGKTLRDIQIYWSYEHQRPSESESEHDGYFTNNETKMTISPHGETKFTQDNIYFAIYAREPLEFNDLLIGFGNAQNANYVSAQIRQHYVNAEKARVFAEKQKQKAQGQARTMLEVSDAQNADGSSQRKVLTRHDKLRLFHQNITLKVKNLMFDDEERLIFLRACDELKEQQNGKKRKKVASNKKDGANQQPQKELEIDEEIKGWQQDNDDQSLDKQPSLNTPLVKKMIDPFQKEMTQEQSAESTKMERVDDLQVYESAEQQAEHSPIAYEKEPEGARKWPSSFKHFKNLERLKEEQEVKQQNRQYQNYKYSLFLLMRQDLLKSIKEEKLENRYTKLKRIKRVRRLIILRKLTQILSKYFNNYSENRTKRLRKVRAALCSVRVQLQYRRQLRLRYRGTQKKLEKRIIFTDSNKTSSRPNSQGDTRMNITGSLRIQSKSSSRETASLASGQQSSQKLRSQKRQVKFVDDSKHMNNLVQTDSIQLSIDDNEQNKEAQKPLKSKYSQELAQKKLRSYIQPSFYFLSASLFNVQRDNQLLPKQILLETLRNYRRKCTMIIYFKRTIQSIINLQRFVQAFFKRKLYWQAILQERVKKEIKALVDFISLMRPLEHKQNHEWILGELLQIGDEDVAVVCKRMIDVIKDMQVLDCYRYNTQYLSAQYTHEVIDGARKFFLRSQEEFCPQLAKQELLRYPPYLLLDPNLKIPDKKKKKKLVVQAVIQRERRERGGVGKMLKAMRNSNQPTIDPNETIDSDQRLVPLEEIEKLYKTLKIRKRAFHFYDPDDLIPEEPYIDIQYEMLDREMKPGYIALSDQGAKAKLKKMPTDDIPFLYEFNSYNELVLFCAIEARYRKVRQSIEQI